MTFERQLEEMYSESKGVETRSLPGIIDEGTLPGEDKWQTFFGEELPYDRKYLNGHRMEIRPCEQEKAFDWVVYNRVGKLLADGSHKDRLMARGHATCATMEPQERSFFKNAEKNVEGG